MATCYLEEVIGPNYRLRKPAINKVLEQLLELYLIHTAFRHMNDILRVSFIILIKF